MKKSGKKINFSREFSWKNNQVVLFFIIAISAFLILFAFASFLVDNSCKTDLGSLKNNELATANPSFPQEPIQPTEQNPEYPAIPPALPLLCNSNDDCSEVTCYNKFCNKPYGNSLVGYCSHEPLSEGSEHLNYCDKNTENNLPGECDGEGNCLRNDECFVNEQCGKIEAISRSYCNGKNICQMTRVPQCSSGKCNYIITEECNPCNKINYNSKGEQVWETCQKCQNLVFSNGNANCVVDSNLNKQKCKISQDSEGSCDESGKCALIEPVAAS
jgi:hypothetical protein